MPTVRSCCIAALCAVALLAGCATTFDEGVSAFNSGNYRVAEMRFAEAAQQGEPAAWSNLGLVYERTGKMGRAIDAYTLGARYGVYHAQQQLVRLGREVPPADLYTSRQAPTSSGWGDALAIGLSGAAAYQSGLNSVPRQPSQPAAVQAPSKTTCSSKWDDFTKTLKTVCQ